MRSLVTSTSLSRSIVAGRPENSEQDGIEEQDACRVQHQCSRKGYVRIRMRHWIVSSPSIPDGMSLRVGPAAAALGAWSGAAVLGRGGRCKGLSLGG